MARATRVAVGVMRFAYQNTTMIAAVTTTMHASHKYPRTSTFEAVHTEGLPFCKQLDESCKYHYIHDLNKILKQLIALNSNKLMLI